MCSTWARPELWALGATDLVAAYPESGDSEEQVTLQGTRLAMKGLLALPGHTSHQLGSPSGEQPAPHCQAKGGPACDTSPTSGPCGSDSTQATWVATHRNGLHIPSPKKEKPFTCEVIWFSWHEAESHGPLNSIENFPT